MPIIFAGNCQMGTASMQMAAVQQCSSAAVEYKIDRADSTKLKPVKSKFAPVHTQQCPPKAGDVHGLTIVITTIL